ncbi:NACHT domain-containing protein [Lentzea sp. NPDC058450]|uniref:NACHT domain-containing protein n=1 Tax=Lentzea sp. NPDC058450 TaxID=3346505 RepID=UPI00365E1C58
MGKHLAPLLMALVPPAAAFAWLQTWAAAHPVQAMAILLAWQALVWGATLVTKLVGGTADELNQKWKVRLANAIDGVVSRLFSGYRGRYRKAMLSNLRFVDLKGLATMGFYTPRLDEVFVDVSLVHSDPQKVASHVIGGRASDSDRRFLGDLIDQPTPVVLAVIGAPGCGKTTLLRHTAMLVCRNRRRRPVPVLLYLRDHVHAIANDRPLTTLTDRNAPSGWFERKLQAGRCVVLLDGLDEVADLENRLQVSEWVERQVAAYPDNDFVITSRPHGYYTAPVSGAEIVQVRGFTDEQVTRFVRSWYLAFEQRSTQEKSAVIAELAAQESTDLLERLRQNTALYELTVNPLLLTMIANVHKFRGALPGSRVDLYGEICQVLLWRRQEAKKLESELTGDQKMALLSALAYSMMARRLRDLSRDQIAVEVRNSLQRMTNELDETRFLEQMTSCGLLMERERDIFAFAHLTFQEYLAAHYIREKQAISVLVESVDDVWWRETTLLHVARANADPIVEACLSAGSAEALSLAFDCQEQGSELARALRSELDQLLDVAHDPNAADDLRHLMTRVELARYLRNRVRTGEGTHICSEPVPVRIYRLFLLHSPDRTPDVPLGAPDDPARGMWPDDAADFVWWVNHTVGVGQTFGLGRTAELMSSPLAAKINSLSPYTPDDNHAGHFSITRGELMSDLENDVDLLFEQLSSAAVTFVSLGTSFNRFRPPVHVSSLKLLKLNVSATNEDAEVVLGQLLAQGMLPPPSSRSKFIGKCVQALSAELVFPADDAFYAAVLRSPSHTLRLARKAALTDWGTARIKSFIEAVSAVFHRRVPLTPELAAELRILALCLEGEATQFNWAPFLDLAASLSVMQRRADGRLPANETIILATD